jgi:hypothetical protein
VEKFSAANAIEAANGVVGQLFVAGHEGLAGGALEIDGLLGCRGKQVPAGEEVQKDRHKDGDHKGRRRD